jgi:hypothetical protein
MWYLKMRPQPTLATKTTLIVRHGGPGIELAQPAEGESVVKSFEDDAEF